MKKTTLTTANHDVIAYISVDAHGVHTITDHQHSTLGYYDPRTNRTTSCTHRLVGYGYQLPHLIGGLEEESCKLKSNADLLAEAEPRKPIKPESPAIRQSGGIPPMSPAQHRRENLRKQSLQDKINTEQRRSSERQAGLRAQLNKKPA